MVAAARRAAEIVNRIRALSKRTKPDLLPLDLNQMLQEILTLMRGELVHQQVSLRLELESGLPAIRGDRIQLQQVVVNLIINGIQAMAGVASALHPSRRKTDRLQKIRGGEYRHLPRPIVTEVIGALLVLRCVSRVHEILLPALSAVFKNSEPSASPLTLSVRLRFRPSISVRWMFLITAPRDGLSVQDLPRCIRRK